MKKKEIDMKEFLNKRICDTEECSNTETWNEFIISAEEEFGLRHIEIKDYDQFKRYIDFLDELYYK